jgi:hypothetical protein
METFVPEQMKLGSKEAVLVGVEGSNEIAVINVNGLASVFTPEGNSQIEFSFTSPESLDFANSYFEADFQYRLANGSVDVNGLCNNFADLIDRVEMYIDSQQVFSTSSREISLIQNLLLVSEGSKSYLENEGKFHLGYNSQTVNNFATSAEISKFDVTIDVAGANPADRTTNRLPVCHQARVSRGRLGAVSADWTRIHIPLFALHMALGSMDGYLPCLGSQIRMILHLNPARRCISTGTATTATYGLTQCRLYVQEVLLSADYKSALMEKVSSPEGLSIHYFDVDVTALAPVATAQSHQFVVRNDHSNAKSLYLFDVDGAALPIASTEVTPWTFPSMRTHLGITTDVLRVESGSKLFTGINGSVGTMSHFNHLLKCAGRLADLSSMGSLSTSYFRVGATATPAVNQARVFAPLGVNLEKATIADTQSAIINAGLSASDPMVSRDINVRLEMNTAWDANWRLYAFLLHSKTLVFSNKSISIVD